MTCISSDQRIQQVTAITYGAHRNPVIQMMLGTEAARASVGHGEHVHPARGTASASQLRASDGPEGYTANPVVAAWPHNAVEQMGRAWPAIFAWRARRIGI